MHNKAILRLFEQKDDERQTYFYFFFIGFAKWYFVFLNFINSYQYLISFILVFLIEKMMFMNSTDSESAVLDHGVYPACLSDGDRRRSKLKNKPGTKRIVSLQMIQTLTPPKHSLTTPPPDPETQAVLQHAAQKFHELHRQHTSPHLLQRMLSTAALVDHQQEREDSSNRTNLSFVDRILSAPAPGAPPPVVTQV